MQETVENRDIENLDLSKIAALQQKRTLAFVNHFVVTTVQFLNTFSKTCENKLRQFEEKLEKVDAAIVLLESRLSSIPEINDVSVTVKKDDVNDNTENEEQSSNEVNETKLNIEDKKEDKKTSTISFTVQTKPEYERFLKMIQVGVPLEAVKLKVSLEGLDPKELDNQLKK